MDDRYIVVGKVAMVVATVTVFAMAQDDNQVCVIFQRCHQKVSNTHCFA